MTAKEISDLIYHQWKIKLSKEERETYIAMAKDAEQKYSNEIEEEMKTKNSLRKQIHDLKYSHENFTVKPSGKLKYMSAFRFFRKELVPLIKS